MHKEHFQGCLGGRCNCEERRYWRVLAISICLASLEFTGSFISGSLALASDAVHVLFDGLAAAFAIHVARVVHHNHCQEDRLRRRGGYLQAGLLLVVVAWLVYEATERLTAPHDVAGPVMLVIATIGAAGNYWQHSILARASAQHITHLSFSWHVLSDFWQSIGVILSGLIVAVTGYTLIDPLLSLAIALYLCYGVIKLVRASQARCLQT